MLPRTALHRYCYVYRTDPDHAGSGKRLQIAIVSTANDATIFKDFDGNEG
jgi:hypothetical protein